MVLGCSPFEQRHTGELMASFVEDVLESWGRFYFTVDFDFTVDLSMKGY